MIDEILPAYELHEVHSRHIRSSAAGALDAARAVAAREIRSLAPLWALRVLPGLFLGKRVFRFDRAAAIWETAQRVGFVVLGERPDAVVIGHIGQYWRPGGGDRPSFGDLDGYQAFDQPGFAKVATDLRVVPEGDGVRLTTETRVGATDADAAARMRRYWTVIRPFSGLIRLGWLKAAKRRAEP